MRFRGEVGNYAILIFTNVADKASEFYRLPSEVALSLKPEILYDSRKTNS